MTKFAIIHPDKPSKPIRRAIAFLSEFLLDFTLEYPFCFSENDIVPENIFRIYVGTKENNKKVKELSDVILNKEEQYNISVSNEQILIEGADDAGVLYGVIYFIYLLFIG